MKFTTLTENEFAKFSEEQQNMNFWQTTSMAHLRKWNGWEYDYVGIKNNHEIIAAAMISYRKIFMGMTFAQSVRGFYIDYENELLMRIFHDGLCNYLKKIRCIYFKIDPYVTHLERDIDGNLVENGYDHSGIVSLLLSLGYRHEGYLRGMTTTREPNWMFVKNIKDRTEKELLKEFDSRARRMINKTIKLGIIVRELKKDEISTFKAIMNHTSKRRGFEDHSVYYYKGLFETFGEDNRLKILIAQIDLNDYDHRLKKEKDMLITEMDRIDQKLSESISNEKLIKKKNLLKEQINSLEIKQKDCSELRNRNKSNTLILGGATFLLVGKEIIYLFGGAYEDYMNFNAQYALQWYMMCYGMQNGFERYNFYGISGVFDKNDEGYGVYEFKRGFHGVVEELIGDFYLYLHPTCYKLYSGLRKVKRILPL